MNAARPNGLKSITKKHTYHMMPSAHHQAEEDTKSSKKYTTPQLLSIHTSHLRYLSSCLAADLSRCTTCSVCRSDLPSYMLHDTHITRLLRTGQHRTWCSSCPRQPRRRPPQPDHRRTRSEPERLEVRLFLPRYR